ncbi:MFS general substrate transporter [Crepidotus variabilis]|uniref:MFS general substrate transporter n=1 Tax=Crepidotus variabilis TaxID=179855 RepID=A0A9P6JSM9_9AGAR|nr:MFS general substrate transporter [Crepidotus variabilis]
MSSTSNHSPIEGKDETRTADNQDEKVEIQNDSVAPTSNSSNEPESRFTRPEKWFIVLFAAYVGLFSPLTANIYFPAIPTLSKAFNKSTELINLTVTMYMVLQGVAPMVWGPLSDHVGRRPISAACLLVLSLSCVGLALVPTNAYWLLMLLRCVQAAGSASTIAVGAGVVGDISTRAERGGFFGIFTVGPMIGPAIGPVIGGALTGSLGWRSIFWFLTIAASICFVIIILFQPETLRTRVESGRDNTPIMHKPIIPIIGRKKPLAPRQSPTLTPRIAKNPFRIFLNVDVDILLGISALACAVFYGVLASISSLFVQFYPYLTEIDVGLCFLGIGGGMAIGSTVMGKVLDIEYQRIKRTMRNKVGGEEAQASLAYQEDDFPIELARLRLMPIYVVILAACCAGYGWALEKRVNIALPVVLHFIMGFVSISLMNTSSTLMIDLLPGQSSSVTACSNLTRCTLSAVLVSLIDIIIRSIGAGWTYVLHSGIALLILPLIFLSVRFGPRYRMQRRRLQLASTSS